MVGGKLWEMNVNAHWIPIRPNDRDNLFINLLLKIVVQCQESNCGSERLRGRLYDTIQSRASRGPTNSIIRTMPTKKQNKHIPNQLLVAQLELATFAFVRPNQRGEQIVPSFGSAGRIGPELDFAIGDLGTQECHDLLMGFFRFFQAV
jgi:hypothetical protein